MGLVSTIARRSLLGHPGRTLFSILGVALGIATVVAVFTLDHVTVLSRTQTLDAGWGADLEVRPRADLEDPREELLQLEGVAGVAAFFQNDVRFRPARIEEGDDATQRIRMVGLEAGASRQLGVYHVEQGTDLDPGDPRGILIGRPLAEAFGLEVGDPVLLAPPVRAAKKRCVDGEMQVTGGGSATPMVESFRVAGVLANEGIGRKSKGNVVVADYEAGRRLLQDVFVSSQYWIRRNEATDLERLETNLQTGFTFERNASRAVGQAADERAFRNGVRMAGLFALLLGLFVIFHTLSMSLLERQREVGALHALAASRGQIARVFFAEALVIALAAGALGLGGGLGLAKALLGLGITTLGVTRPVALIEVPWDTVLLLASLGIGIALLGSVYPILRMRGTDVVTTLRGEDPGRRGGRQGFQLFTTLLLVAVVPAVFFQVVPIVGAAESTLVGTVLVGLVALGLLVGMPLLFPALVAGVTTRMARAFEGPFPLAGKLATQNLRQNPGRIGAAIAAIALVTAAFVGLKGMTRSLAAEVAVWGDAALGNKVLVERLPDVPVAAVAEALRAQPGVNAVESGDARVFVSFLLLGARSDELGRFGPLAADPTLLTALREKRGMIVSERLARQRGLAPGDPVLVNTSGHGVQEFRVIAVTDAYGYFFHPDERAYGIIDDRHVEKYFCLDTATTRMIAVHMDEPDMELVRTALAERFPAARGLAFHDGRSVVDLMLEDLTRDFVLFDIILGLTAALAGLGVLNGQLLSALERQKEFGVLRALGMTRGQVAGVVFLESGIVGLSGAILGVAVGTGLTPVLVESLRLLSDLPLPLRTAGPWIAFSVVGALVLAFLAGLYPIWRTNRLDAVRAVRTG